MSFNPSRGFKWRKVTRTTRDMFIFIVVVYFLSRFHILLEFKSKVLTQYVIVKNFVEFVEILIILASTLNDTFISITFMLYVEMLKILFCKVDIE